MSRIPRTGRQLTMPARPAKRCWQSAPPTASARQTADSTSADKYPVVGPLSFRRIVDIPYQTCVAALGSWQAEQHGELLVGQSMLSGPFERDGDSGTRRIEVRLARGPLRPRLRMRLDIDRWSATSIVLELIPLSAGPAHRGLLPGRPPPARRPDPFAAAVRTAAAPGQRPRQPATRASQRTQRWGAGRGGRQIGSEEA